MLHHTKDVNKSTLDTDDVEKLITRCQALPSRPLLSVAELQKVRTILESAEGADGYFVGIALP